MNIARRSAAVMVAAVMVAVLTSAAALTGCTSSGAGAPARQTSPTAERKDSKPDGLLPPGVTAETSVPTFVPNKPALRKDVAMTTCTIAPGGWRASGTARNPGHHTVNYKITIFFTAKTATVIGVAATKLTLKPGATRTWNIHGKFQAPKPTLCVLRGVG